MSSPSTFAENLSPAAASQIIAQALVESLCVTLAKAAMESVPLLEAVGKILAEPILADRPQPPFHRVATDGIAVQSENLLQGARAFLIEGMQKAGEVEKLFPANKNADKKASCIEVMTGAVLPLGADCVIPF